MKKNLIYLGILLIALVIQSSFFPPLFSFRPIPELILIIIISWTAIFGFNDTFWRTILAGLFYDIAFNQKVGTEIIILVIIAYSVSFLSRRFLVENKFLGGLVLVGFVLGATLIHNFYNEFILVLSSDWQIKEVINIFFLNILYNWSHGIFYNIILFAFCFWILKRTENRPALIV